jgi:hypothetical protein
MEPRPLQPAPYQVVCARISAGAGARCWCVAAQVEAARRRDVGELLGT